MKKVQTSILVLLLAAVGVAHGDISRPPPLERPTSVWMSVFVVDVDQVESAEQSFLVNVYYKAKWRDPRLAHRQPGKVRRPLNEIWHPGLQLINRQMVFNSFLDSVEIAQDGEVTYRQRVWGSFSQPLSLHDFPFDRQTFGVEFVAEPYSSSEIEFRQDPQAKSGIADILSFADWQLLGWQVRAEEYMPSADVSPRARFVFSFDLKRRYGYYVLKIILPLIFIVAMSWTVFWIDPNDGGVQINVAITTILTLIAYQFSVGEVIPRVDYMTRLDLFILISTALIFASLIEVIITATLSRHGRTTTAISIDRWSRVLFPLVFVGMMIILTPLGPDFQGN